MHGFGHRDRAWRDVGAIAEVVGRVGVPEEALQPYGRHIAKVDLNSIRGLEHWPHGKLVLMTAISPTLTSKDKTTTVGLTTGWTISHGGIGIFWSNGLVGWLMTLLLAILLWPLVDTIRTRLTGAAVRT